MLHILISKENHRLSVDVIRIVEGELCHGACVCVCALIVRLLLAAFNSLSCLLSRAINPLVFGLAVTSKLSEHLTVVVGDINCARACLL